MTKSILDFITINVKPEEGDYNTPSCTIYLEKNFKSAKLEIGLLYLTPLKIGKGAHEALNITLSKIYDDFKANPTHTFFTINDLSCIAQHCSCLELDEKGQTKLIEVF